MSTFRFLGAVDLAVEVKASQPFRLDLAQPLPLVVVRPVSFDEVEQMNEGGSYIALEFQADHHDLLRAAAEGLSLVNNLLGGLSIISTVPFGSARPIQVLDLNKSTEGARFAFFLRPKPGRWPTAVTTEHIALMQMAWLHWRELTTGGRQRRAARRYAQALTEENVLDAFLLAWLGLEALNRPLADELGVESNEDVVVEKCKHCGAENERRRPALVGVRGIIRGELHQAVSDARTKEWRRLSDLRNDLMHGRKDEDELEKRCHDLISAVLHYLHDGCVHLAHLHELETVAFQPPLTIPLTLVAMGQVNEIQRLEHWEPMLSPELSWISHPTYRFVPEYNLQAPPSVALGSVYFLNKSLADANESDLILADVDT